MAASFPPVPLPFGAFVALVPLLLVLEAQLIQAPHLPKRRGWRAFGYAYLFFLVFNLGVNYWLLFTGWNMPDFATRLSGLLSGVMANVLNPLLQALPLVLYYKVRRSNSLGLSLLMLGAGFLAFEYLHFNWELSWSWTTLGNAFASVPWYVQYIEYTGVLGASAQILAVNLVGFAWLMRWQQRKAMKRRDLAILASLVLLPLLMWPLLARSSRSVYEPQGRIAVRVVQPNIDPTNYRGWLS